MAKNGYLERRKQHIDAVASQRTKTAIDRTMWLAIVALNDEFGFAEIRAQRFFERMHKVAEAYNSECWQDGDDVANEHLRLRLEKILKCEVKIEKEKNNA